MRGSLATCAAGAAGLVDPTMKDTMKQRLLVIALPIMLAGCATAPTGPSVLVLPGTGKSFDQFNRDEVYCRDYAIRGLDGKGPGKISTDSNLATAVAGTAIGAVAGAAIGGHDGAAIGAGTGLLFGSAMGGESGRYERSTAQTRYDNSYIQCMYGLGHRVPVPAGMYTHEARPVSSAPATTAPPPPPPPPGNPPPPPPGVR